MKSFNAVVCSLILLTAALASCGAADNGDGDQKISLQGQTAYSSEILTADAESYPLKNSRTVIKDSDGNYRLLLSCTDQTVQINGSKADHLPYISDELVYSAETVLSEKVSKYKSAPVYYLYIDDDGYLCLGVEVIEHFETASEKYGCGDHEHYMYYERISVKPIQK